MRSADAVRLVPRDPNPYDETVALIERFGWEPTEDFSDDLFEWRTPEGDAVIRWVNDGDTGVHFFVVEGAARQRVAGQIEEAIDTLHVEDFEDFLAGTHGTHGLLLGLYTVAAAAPEHADRRVLDLFERYFTAEDPMVRRVAALATTITGWQEFATPVGRLREDPDPDVRRAASAALRGLAGAS